MTSIDPNTLKCFKCQKLYKDCQCSCSQCGESYNTHGWHCAPKQQVH